MVACDSLTRVWCEAATTPALAAPSGSWVVELGVGEGCRVVEPRACYRQRPPRLWLRGDLGLARGLHGRALLLAMASGLLVVSGVALRLAVPERGAVAQHPSHAEPSQTR